MKKKLLLSIYMLCFLFLFTGLASAQVTVTGTVKDATGTLPGVSVQIKGTILGTITDVEGKFSLNLPDANTVLVFSFVGYAPQEVLVQGQKTLEITLMQDAQNLSEFVVVGYGVQRKSDLTGATSRLSGDNLNKSVASSPVEMMQGRVSGVNIAQNNGEPGGGMTVRVRGSNSIRSGQDPLYVIDGVPLDNQDLTPAGSGTAGLNGSSNKDPISFLNPNDIASIDILKDASSTAIYGARGANGVIMITTKKGEQGAGQLSYDGYAGTSTIRENLNILSADQFRAYRKPDGSALIDLGANTNWQDEIYRTAFTQSHNLSYGGGTKNGTYRASLGYLDQDGIVNTTNMQKVNGKITVTQKAFNDKLELSANLIASHTKDQRAPISETGGYEGDVILTSLKLNPTYPIYNEDGTYYQNSTTQRNPVAMLNLTNDITQTDQTIANLTAEYEIIKDLKYKLNVGSTRSSIERRINQDNELTYLPNHGEADINTIHAQSSLIENYLTYAKKIEENQLNFLLGYAYQKFNINGTAMNVKGFVVNDILYTNNLGYGNSSAATTSSYANVNELQSYFGRVNYAYAGKYLVTLTGRYDGSSKFGDNNKYGFFPSAALAWRLSDEEFIKSLKVFSNLKLRLGWGMTGNQEIPNKISQILVGTSGNANGYFNGVLTPGITFLRVPNPNIQWETTIQSDLGLDFGFFKNRLTATIDLFHKETKDVLLEINAAAPAAAATMWLNVPDLRIINNGIEIGVEGIIVEKTDFTWDAGFNVSYIKNNVIDLPVTMIETGNASGQGLSGTRVQIITNDNPIGTFYGRVFEGFDASGISIYKKDADGADALETLGSALPNFTFSFNTKLTFKAFDFSMFWYGVSGNKVYNNTANALFVKGSLNSGANVTEDVLNSAEGIANSNAFSSRFVEDGSFLRLANLTLGYTLNTKAVNWIKSARIYATGNNLLLLTKYTGFDPEVNSDASQNGVPAIGMDYTSYPKARAFTVGASLNF
jgi:iron complex outermembrane receptor protein